jgi:membrane protease YdiL (CAAX protease family)
MFNRYWRTYPWGLQVALFFLTWFTLMSFATYLVLALIPKLTGLSFDDLTQLSSKSSIAAIKAGLWTQAISHAGTFAVPGLLFAAFTHPRMREYLGLRAPGKAIHWVLVTGLMLGLLPIFLWGEAWMMQHLHLGKWADAMQKTNDDTIGAFMHLDSGGGVLILLVVLAALPAFGEEIVFRGIILRLLHRRMGRRLFADPEAGYTPQDVQWTMFFPVIISALFFAGFHYNPYGFVFIFIAGCVLALIYFLTGSLLCSMWAHLLYNGLQVVAVFFNKHDVAAQKIAQGENLPAIYPLIGLALFAICFYLLVKHQTSLPADWSDDFKGERPKTEDESDTKIPYI